MIQIYPEKLEEFLSNKNYIPRKLKPDEHLKQYKRYWFSSNDNIEYMKVIDVYHINNVEYYSVRYNSSLYGEISMPINDDGYELMIDSESISNIKNMINNNTSYLGAEIRYWFFKNHIDLESDKYCNFWSYINQYSKNPISDNKFYFLKATLNDNGNYTDCRVILDKKKEMKRKS